jgi:hypothetical protein
MADNIYGVYSGEAPDGWYGASFSVLQWTTAPPTVKGWYWARTNKGKPYIVKVDEFGLGISGNLWVYVVGTDKAIDLDFVDYWLGPIPEPEPPK